MEVLQERELRSRVGLELEEMPACFPTVERDPGMGGRLKTQSGLDSDSWLVPQGPRNGGACPWGEGADLDIIPFNTGRAGNTDWELMEFRMGDSPCGF